MLHKKYAPQSLSEMVFANSAAETRVTALANAQLSSNFVLLYGPNGTGKSTAARLIVNTLTSGNFEIEKKSVSELLKLNDLHGYLKQQHFTSSTIYKSKYILKYEEFDNAKGDLYKLWTAIDDIDEDITLIATTNEPLDIHKSLRSRFYKLEMSPISAHQFLPRAMHILKSEGYTLDSNEVLSALKTRQHEMDLRAYFQVLEELILLEKMKFKKLSNEVADIDSTLLASTKE